MGRRASAFIIAAFVAPFVVQLLVNVSTPWLQANAGVIGQALTSSWLPWGLYAVLGVPWFYYWFVVVARRVAPQARLQRINDLFTEQQAIRLLVMPDAGPAAPRGLMKRVLRFKRDVGSVLGADLAYRPWLDACWQFEAILASPEQDQADPPRYRWRSATLALLFASDSILRDLQIRLSPEGPRSPRTSKRDRSGQPPWLG